MEVIHTRTGLFKYTVHSQNELMKANVHSAITTHFVVGVDITRKPLKISLLFLVLSLSFHVGHGLIYKTCQHRTVPSGQLQQGDKSPLYFAVMLAATENNTRSECKTLNWRNVRNLVAIQWVVDKLNTPNKNNQTFIPGHNIDFYVFDDCGQRDLAFDHITDILKPSQITRSNECRSPPKMTSPFFAILSLGEASITESILEVAKMAPIPVVNPRVNLESFQKYRNFISLSTQIDYPVKALLQLLQKLKWTYTGIIYSNTEFGQQMKDRLISSAINYGICFAFNEKTSQIDQIKSEIDKVVKKVKVHQLGIVYLGDVSDMGTKFKNDHLKINCIIFDSFTKNFKIFETSSNPLKGALTLYAANVDVNDFKVLYDEKIRNLTNSQNTNAPIDSWIKDMLNQTNQKLETIPNVDIRDDVSSIMDAVYVIATSKKEICLKTPSKCKEMNQQYSNDGITVVDYAKMASFSPREFHENNRTITITNNTLKSEKPSRAIFNVLNFWNGNFNKVGTFNQHSELSVSLNAIKMIDEKSNIATGNNLPKSLCSKVCQECQQPEFSGRIAYIPGDILILGIFSVHDSGPGFECGRFRKDSTDSIASEAFLYTITNLQKVNPNITVGGIAIDDCYNSIQTSMNITMILSGAQKLSDPKTGEIIDTRKIVVVVGPLSSGVSKSVADLLTHKKIPMISYAASSPDLDDKISYPYFLRTVPSDIQQVNAILALLDRMDWRYVGIIYANNNYGAKAKELFLASAQKSRICVSSPKPIEESSEKASSSEIEYILDNLMKDQVKIVVYFGTNSRVNDLVQALKGKGMENYFVFIGCETWGITPNPNIQAVAGSLTLTLDGSKTTGTKNFRAYLKTRYPHSSTPKNPFFNMFWYSFHKCNPPNGFRNEFDKVCTGSERFSNADAKKFSRDQRSVQTMNAVYAAYEGIKAFQETECRYKNKIPCDRFSTHVKKFVSITKNIKLDGYDDVFDVFDKNGNGRNTFNIHNIQRNETQYIYKLVGTYNIEYDLALYKARVCFYDQRLQQIPYVNVTCVRSYKCCDHLATSSTDAGSKQATIRPIDIIILSILSPLFIFLMVIGTCYLIRFHKMYKGNGSKFQNREATLNRSNPNGIPVKRPQRVYIRPDDASDSLYGGVVTYQIVRADQREISQLTPVSQTNSTPNYNEASQVHTNSGFEPDNVFLFPDTVNQPASSSYEEIARPLKLERASVPPQRPSSKDRPPLPSAKCNSDSTLGRKNVLHDDAFII